MGTADPPDGVDPVPRPTDEGSKRLRHSSTPVDPVSKVLGDDNLLIEIIMCLEYATTLVRAALVCKRWLSHASDPALLRRFRELHPPRLLGLYVQTLSDQNPLCFVPMLPQPREFNTIIRRASFRLGTYEGYRTDVQECRNGHILVRFFKCNGSMNLVHTPLCPERDRTILPPLPRHQIRDGNVWKASKLFLKEEGAGMSYLFLVLECAEESKRTMGHVYMLQDGAWRMHTSATTELPCQLGENLLLVDNKIYMLASPTDILILDLTASSFSTIQLPEGVVWRRNFSTMHPPGLLFGESTMLSRADDDSGLLYLIHSNELRCVIWLHKEGNWLLVDTICLGEMCADLMKSDRTLKDRHDVAVWIRVVGVNAKFVLFTADRCIFYWDIKCRTVRKVHEMQFGNSQFKHIYPFMMVWPPKFPALKDDHARDAV